MNVDALQKGLASPEHSQDAANDLHWERLRRVGALRPEHDLNGLMPLDAQVSVMVRVVRPREQIQVFPYQAVKKCGRVFLNKGFTESFSLVQYSRDREFPFL